MPTLTRCREPEIMDSPDLEEGRHRQALRALGRINRLSRSAGRLWAEIRHHALRPRRRPLRILDLACGGGDVALALEAIARRRGVEVAVEGRDISAVAVARAREHAARRGATARFVRSDILRDEIPFGHDVIYCNLFLHHLDEDEAAALLARMAGAGAGMVVVQDLERSLGGLALAFLGVHTLTRSSVARIDGLRSVRAAYTAREALELARRAGLEAEVRRCWPCRFSLSWRRP